MSFADSCPQLVRQPQCEPEFMPGVILLPVQAVGKVGGMLPQAQAQQKFSGCGQQASPALGHQPIPHPHPSKTALFSWCAMLTTIAKICATGSRFNPFFPFPFRIQKPRCSPATVLAPCILLIHYHDFCKEQENHWCRTVGINDIKVTSDSSEDSELKLLMLIHEKKGYYSYTEKL